jgi:hypothetical protein
MHLVMCSAGFASGPPWFATVRVDTLRQPRGGRDPTRDRNGAPPGVRGTEGTDAMADADRRASDGTDEFDETAIAAIHAKKTTPGPARRLAPFLAELEAGYPAHFEVTDDARRELAQFDRDSLRLGERLAVEMETLFTVRGGPIWIDTPPFVLRPPELKHVFGPDPQNTGNPNAYRLNWGHVDGFPGTGIDARPNAREGTFSASHYATGNSTLSAFAGIGVRLTPNLDWCHLAVRPFVQWSGSDILNHHDAMPDQGEQRRGRASGAIGILIQSWDLAGGSFHEDADHSVDMWDRIEFNPSGGRDYEGTADTNSLAVQILASGNRRYSIWVYCWAYVESQTGFAVATRSSAMIACHMPYLFVEEIKI